jgi:GntR family transcriptional regulator
MLTLRLDRASPIPLYYQIQQQLRDAILSGQLGPGDPIPPEPTLATDTAVSRFTIRQAIDDLVREGLVVRHRGRGTFVTYSADSPTARPLATFAAAFSAQGLGAPRIVSFNEAAATTADRSGLDLRASESVIHIVRVRDRDGAPVALERISIPGALVPGLQPTDLEANSLGEVLRRRYGIEITRAVETLKVSPLDKDAAEVLDSRAGTQVFCIERRSFATNRVVETRTSFIRPDRFHFELAPGQAELERD